MLREREVRVRSQGPPLRRARLSRRLVIAVNLALSTILGLFLVVDYQIAARTLFEQRRSGLGDEAKILLRAIIRLRPSGTPVVQAFLDETCGDMQEATSPGHHIAARLGTESLQAVTHHRASPDILGAMEEGAGRPDGRAPLGAETIVVAAASRDDAVLYVSEYVSDIQRLGRQALARRIIAIVAVGVALGIVCNALLSRVLMRPLQRMVETVRRFSQGRFDARMPRADNVELGVLSDEFDHMAAALEKANAERDAQMAKARRIQDNLLPDLAKVRDVRLACLFQPVSEVAGDYYDVVALADGARLFCIADVTGHGVPAAMGAAMLKSLLQIAVERETEPERLLGLLDTAFDRISLQEDFATMTLVRFDRSRRVLAYASAGHGMAHMVRKEGAIEVLDSTGPALGFGVRGKWTTERIVVAPGDRMVIVTDGVMEAASPEGEFYGGDRLRAFLDRSRTEPVDALPASLGAAISSHRGSAPQLDDVTVLAIEF